MGTSNHSKRGFMATMEICDHDNEVWIHQGVTHTKSVTRMLRHII
jgi:hypothetical protein